MQSSNRSTFTLSATEWTLSPAWKAVDFLSDLHLSADTPKTFAAWENHLRTSTADAFVMLGDWLELWVGDDARQLEFGRRCTEVLSVVTQSRPVLFMVGNRDFLLGDEMLAACGMQGLSDPTIAIGFGQRLLLSHGDALCLGDTEYLKFRAMVRNPAWQQQFLALPLQERLRIGSEIRNHSEKQKDGRSSPAEWVDVDESEAVRCLLDTQADILLHGHTHKPAEHFLPEGKRRLVLSDWDFDHPPYRADVLRWDASGMSRVALSG